MSNLIGECCEIMKLTLERRPANAMGLDVSQCINFKTGKTREVAVYRFRKAKKGDDGKYGYGKQYADSTFAPVQFCPFCGAKNAQCDTEAEEDAPATPTGGEKASGET